MFDDCCEICGTLEEVDHNGLCHRCADNEREPEERDE